MYLIQQAKVLIDLAKVLIDLAKGGKNFIRKNNSYKFANVYPFLFVMLLCIINRIYKCLSYNFDMIILLNKN